MSSLVQTNTDLPKNLIISDLEVQILNMYIAGKRTREISAALGVTITSITKLLAREDVNKFMEEMINARNTAIKMELPNLLLRIIEDKIDKAEEEGLTLGEISRRDIVDVIKELSATLKVSDVKDSDDKANGFTKVYQQINMIQKG